MNVTLMFVSAIVMVVIGFITTKLWGINIPKVISDTLMLLVLTLPPYSIILMT